MWDVIVIGAGIEGSATAYTLAKQGRKTLQLEQFSLPHARGSSTGQSRITRKAYPEKFYAQMMVEGFKLWSELEREAQTKLYLQTGLLVFDKKGSEHLMETETSLKMIGSTYRKLSGEELRTQFPMMHYDDSYEAIYDSDGGLLRADKCLQAFQSQFKRYGGALQDAEPVINIEPLDGASVRVRTTKGEYTARSLVITAGPWTNKVLEPIGLTLPLKTARVVVYYWKQLHSGHNLTDQFPVFISILDHKEVFGLPAYEYPGLVKVAFHGGDPIDPDRRDYDVSNTQHRDYTAAFVKRHLPGLEATPSIAENCIYTLTPDENFILDRHPKYKNIVIGAGFSGHGFKLSPIVGKVLAELATGESRSYNLDPFKINRFTNKL